MTDSMHDDKEQQSSVRLSRPDIGAMPSAWRAYVDQLEREIAEAKAIAERQMNDAEACRIELAMIQADRDYPRMNTVLVNDSSKIPPSRRTDSIGTAHHVGPISPPSARGEPVAWLVKSDRKSLGEPWRYAFISKEAAENDAQAERMAGATFAEVVPLYESPRPEAEAIPIELYDGMEVFVEVSNRNPDVKPAHVSDVLDAVVRLIRKNRLSGPGEKE